MTWFNILIALLRSRKARQIVWLHYSTQEKFVALGTFIASLLIIDVALTKHQETQNTKPNSTLSSQAIASINLSNSSITSNTSGNLTVTMSPGSPAFSGMLMLSSSGSNCSDNAHFQIFDSRLETKGIIPDGSYMICITAIGAGIINSPFSTSFIIQNDGEVSHNRKAFNIIEPKEDIIEPEEDIIETTSPLICGKC